MDRKNRFIDSSIPRLLADFAIPSILGLVLHAFYNLVDRIFIGRGVGAEALAGVTLCFPAMLIVFGFCVLLSSGSSSLISIFLGRGSKIQAEKVLGTTIFLTILAGLFISVAGLRYYTDFLALFNASTNVLPHAESYLRVILAGSPLFLFGFVTIFIIRAEGNPLFATAVMVAGTLVNLVLDPIFIFVLHWGTAGAALATVIAELLVALAGIFYLAGKRGLLRIKARHIRMDALVAGRIFYIGLSPALMKIGAAFQVVFLNKKLMLHGGDTALAAAGMILPIAAMIHLFTFGMAAGMQPIVGFNHGAGRPERVKNTLIYACKVNFLAVAGIVIALSIFARNIASLFVTGDEELILMGATAIRIFLIMSPFAALNILGTRYFQAVGKPSISILTGLLREFIIFLPMLYILSTRFKLTGVWFSIPASDLTAAVVTILFLIRELKTLEHPPGSI